MEVILQVYISNSFYKLICWTSSIGECYRTLLMKSQHWFVWWLGAIRKQAITWANVDPDLCHHFSSPGHKEITIRNLWFSFCVIVIQESCDKWSVSYPYHEQFVLCKSNWMEILFIIIDLGHQITTSLVHAKTAHLSCHILNSIAVTVLTLGWEQVDISNLNYGITLFAKCGPRPGWAAVHIMCQ